MQALSAGEAQRAARPVLVARTTSSRWRSRRPCRYMQPPCDAALPLPWSCSGSCWHARWQAIAALGPTAFRRGMLQPCWAVPSCAASCWWQVRCTRACRVCMQLLKFAHRILPANAAPILIASPGASPRARARACAHTHTHTHTIALKAGADPARQLSYSASVATLASLLHGLVPAEQAIPAAAKADMHGRVAACSAMFDATPLDLAVAVDEFTAAERLAAASPEAVLTQALHTWVFAHSGAGGSSPCFSLALLLLGAGADPYRAVDPRHKRSRASFLQRLCASADRPDASKADRCGGALSWLIAWPGRTARLWLDGHQWLRLQNP